MVFRSSVGVPNTSVSGCVSKLMAAGIAPSSRCPLAGFFQQRAMADVYAIEKAKRDNTSFVQAFVTSKKLLIVVRTVFSTLPKSKNSPVML